MEKTHAIHHRIEVETTPARLREALTTKEGLAAWWTPMTEAEPRIGSVARFRFGDGAHGPDMRVEAISDERVAWTCVEGPWKGMHLVFEIAPHERGAVVVFEHGGWPAIDDFFRHCNSKWGYFLAVSLKGWLERGEGAPHPHDPSI